MIRVLKTLVLLNIILIFGVQGGKAQNETISILQEQACTKSISDTIVYNINEHMVKMPAIFDLTKTSEYGPIASSTDLHFTAFSIYTPEEWNKSRTMYSRAIIVAGEDETWDGYWNGNSKYTDDKYRRKHEGAFRYTFRAKADGQMIRCEGWGCLIRKEE